MRTLRNSIAMLGMAALFMCTSCGKSNESEGKSGSDSQTTPNDSSKAESTKAMGIGEDNQNEVSGYPSNQSNLNTDSTAKNHDLDTTGAKTAQPR